MSNKGFTLIEAVVAMTVFVIGTVGLVQLSTLAKATSEEGQQTVKVSNYLQEGVEATRIIRDANWSNMTPGTYRLNAQAGQSPPWQLISGGSETIDGKYQRQVIIATARREDTDGSGTLTAGDRLVSSGGAFDDPDARRVTATITWSAGNRIVSRSIYTYFTNWQ